MKNGTEVTLNVSLNLNSISSYQTNFSDKIFFVDRQISTLRRAFKVIENSTDKIRAIRRNFRWISGTIIKNWFASNEKCT